MSTVLLDIRSDEIRELNRGFGGTIEMNSNVDTVFTSANYARSFWQKVALVVRSIAGGHLFDNGNKRTAFEAVKLFKSRNQVDAYLRETVRLVAIHQLTEIDEIAKSLRGF